MKNKVLLLTLLMSLSGCAIMPLSSSSSINSNDNDSSVITNTSSSEESSVTSSTNTNSSTLGESSNNDYSEKTLVIDLNNFNTLSYIKLEGVENSGYKPNTYTFNANGTMKSKEIKGIKEIKIRVYNTYDNLDLFTNYNGSGNPASKKFVEGNKEATYTYNFEGINEFCIKNTSSEHRTHVYSVTITYTGNAMSGSGNNSSSNTSSSSSSSSSSNKPSSSTNTNSSSSNSSVQLDGNYAGTYYSGLSTNTNGTKLIGELSSLINKGTVTLNYDDLLDAYKTTDVRPGTNQIWDMYSSYSYTVGSDYAPTYKKEGDGYNREHSIPQSWFNEAKPMKTDLFHVYPTDSYVNGKRSSYLYGEVSSASYTSTNGCKLGSSSHSLYSGTVFEPADEYKGDFARTYFYMATRYMDKIISWSKDSVKQAFSDSYPYLTKYSVALFTKWSEQDPVSQKEIDRNNEVYKIQKNRNPYIDHPEFIEVIWG